MPILLDQPGSKYSIAKRVFVYLDKTDRVKINDIITPKLDMEFKPNLVSTLNFGISKNIVWVKFCIRILNSNERWYLKIDNPTLDTVELYQFDSFCRQRTTVTGNLVATAKRDFPVNNFYVKLGALEGNNMNGNTYVCYLRIKSGKSIQIPLHIADDKLYIKEVHQFDIVQILYCGFILFAILYNAFLYIKLRLRIHIVYALYASSISYMFLIYNGYTFDLFDDYIPSLGLISLPLSIISVLYFFKEFTLLFLKTKEHFPKMYAISSWLDLFSLVCFVITLSGYTSEAYWELHFYALAMIVYAMSIGIITAKKRNLNAYYFLTLYSFQMFGAILWDFKDINLWVPYNFLTHNALQIGSMIEIGFFSFLIADRVKEYKISGDNARMLVETQEGEKGKLAENVHEKLAQYFAAAKINIETIKNKIENNGKTEELLSNTSYILENAIKESRYITYDLLPLTNKYDDLKEKLKSMCNRYEKISGMRIYFEAQKTCIESFDLYTKTNIYRICQEILSNAILHSESSVIYFTVFEYRNRTIFEISDNGIGFDFNLNKLTEGKRKNGLTNIINRANTINGEIKYVTKKGEGCKASLLTDHSENKIN
jgi:signal transduction histidine kinase